MMLGTQNTKIVPMDLRSTFTKKSANMMPSKTLEQVAGGASRLSAEPAQRRAQEDICAVCLNSDGAIDTLLLPCRHAFHGDCIIRWVEANFSCPLCRRTIEQFLPIEKGEHVLHLELGEHDSLEDASKSAVARRIKSQEIFLKFIEIWEKHYLQVDSSKVPTKQSYSNSLNKEQPPNSKMSLYAVSKPTIPAPTRTSRTSTLRHSSSFPSFAKLTQEANREVESSILDNINAECRTPALYMDWNPPSLSEFQKLNDTSDIHISTPTPPESVDVTFTHERDLTFQRTDSSFSTRDLSSKIPERIKLPNDAALKIKRNSVGGFGPDPIGSPHVECDTKTCGCFLGSVPVFVKRSGSVRSLQQGHRRKRPEVRTFLDRERFLSRRGARNSNVHFCGKPKPCGLKKTAPEPPPTSTTTTRHQIVESSLPPKLQTANHLKAGCLAGVATALLVHAFDGNARRFTSSVGYQKGFMGGLAVFRGLPGFFSGFAPTLFTVIPTCMVYFSVYEHMKNNTFYVHNPENRPLSQVGAHMISAAIAATLGHMIHKPSSLIPIRYGIQFGAFELGKSIWMHAGRSKGNERQLGPLAIMTTAALGGLAASSVIFPTQNIITRMQLASVAKVQFSSLGINVGGTRAGSFLEASGLSHVVSTVTNNNVQTLYKGWGPALARFLPACVVTATAYEFALRSIANE